MIYTIHGFTAGVFTLPTFCGAKMCQDVPKCAKMCEDVPRCAKMCQDVPRCAKMCQGSQASLSLRPVEVIYDLGSPWVLLLLKSACCISSSDCVGQENKSQNCIVTCGNHTSYKLQTHNCVMLYYQHLSTIQVIRLYLDAEFTYLLQNEIQ